MTRLCLALALALLVSMPAWARAPRLTLFISVDALGSDVLLRNRPHLGGGLGQAMRQGAFFPYARYGYAENVTAAGHTTLSTGADPWRHGIVGNRIVNRATGALEPIFHDPDHPALEAPAGLDDVSPVRLRAETLSDRLRLATRGRGKAVAVSGKARSAIAMAGRLGQAWWFHPQVGKFVTGTWYAKEFPAWVKAFNDGRPADAAFGKSWSLLLPAKAYPGEDDRPYESDWYALGRTFPHTVNGGLSSPGVEYYKALRATPFGNDLVLQMAKAALAGEQLGRDAVPDLLFVSFSATDMVYHLYGPNSWEMQDVLVRLDRQIADLVAAAEKAAGGKQNLLVVISADHGGAAVPEAWTASGLEAPRVDPRKLQAGLNAALRKQFGVDLVQGIEEIDVYLDDRALAQKGLDGATVRRAAARWLSRQPSVAIAVASDDLYGPHPRGGFAGALQRSYYPGRSGDVLFLPRVHHVVTDESAGTNHGTPYTYDAVVPVILVGPGVRAGTWLNEIDVVDVAPTVAALLEMTPPAQAEGAPLEAVLTGR